MVRYLVWLTIFAAAVVFAVFRGGRAERIAAAILVSMIPIDWAYHAIWGNVTLYSTVNVGHLINDLWLMIALTVAGVRADRPWILAMASVQLIAVIAHLVRWQTALVDEDVYAAFTRWTSYLQIALLFIAAQAASRHRINRPS